MKAFVLSSLGLTFCEILWTLLSSEAVRSTILLIPRQLYKAVTCMHTTFEEQNVRHLSVALLLEFASADAQKVHYRACAKCGCCI